MLVFVNIMRELSAFESQGGWMHKSTHVTVAEEEEDEEDEATAVEYISPQQPIQRRHTREQVFHHVCAHNWLGATVLCLCILLLMLMR